MNIYSSLNEIINYIENHLEEKIEYDVLAKMLGVNSYTMQRLFSLLTNTTLTEYIRKRRLSNAGYDLYYSNFKIIDVALKYQYENATSFSRAFTSFHGIKPSEVKKGNYQLKNFSKIVFKEENFLNNEDITYKIVTLDEMTLYGKKKKTNEMNIKKDAPNFFKKMHHQYYPKFGDIDFGMVKYQNRFESDKMEYWTLWNQKILEFEKFIIPKSKWLIFHIPCQEAKDIQKVSEEFYCKFIPSSKYNLRDLPELEYYHDGVTDFLVPIE